MSDSNSHIDSDERTSSSRPPKPSLTEQPLAWLRRTIRGLWNDALSVYYANTPIWRWLKSGSLVFLGFFTWSGASLLLSYRPDWTVLTYVMAYGFVLILWGPLTHFVILPAVIRLRRSGIRPSLRPVLRQASKLNLTVFFVIVIVLGTAPIAPMTLDFTGAVEGDRAPDVNPDLDCVQVDGVVECELSDPTGIDHVVVTSGDREIDRATDPPFSMAFEVDELEEVVGQQQFVVELRDEEGETIRRYTRNLSGVPEA